MAFSDPLFSSCNLELLDNQIGWLVQLVFWFPNLACFGRVLKSADRHDPALARTLT
jgi:hypothetical protein